MKDNLTDITIVLDKSGSMGMVTEDTIGGFNTFLKDQKEAPGEANLSLVLFDTDYNEVHNGVPIKEVPELTSRTYIPGGNTALLDALLRAINTTGARLKAMQEYERPAKVIFVIMTDGQENSSREASRQQVADAIKHQEEIYKWNFVYIGANQDSFHEAGMLGIHLSNVANYTCDSAGTQKAMNDISEGMLSYRGQSGSVARNFFDPNRS
jgi:uncharacterized protein YegL